MKKKKIYSYRFLPQPGKIYWSFKFKAEKDFFFKFSKEKIIME